MNEGTIAESNFRQQRLYLQQKKEERQDRVSGLLTEEAARKDITGYLNKMTPYDTCAMFVISFDNLKQVRDTLGDKEAEKAIIYAGKALASFFRTTDVVARRKDEYFIAFICGAISRKIVADKAGTICQNMQFSVGVSPAVKITVYVGACLISQNSDVTYEWLYKEAWEALLTAKTARRGNFYISTGANELQQDKKDISEYFQSTNASVLPALLECIDGGVCLLEIGEKVKLIYASPGFYEMLALENDAICFPCSLTEAGVHMDDTPEYENMLRKGAKSGKVCSHIHRILDGNQTYRWVNTRAVSVACVESEHPVMLEVSEDISELMDKERQLSESGERLKVACEHSPKVLWEVDVRNKNFKMYNTDMLSYTGENGIYNFPEGLLENGMIHPHSADNFQVFAEDILRGEKGGVANFIVKNALSSRYEWAAFSYHMLYDSDGRPVKAIGVQERLPSITGTTAGTFPRRPLPEIVRHHFLCRIYVNLTENRVEELFMEGVNRTKEVGVTAYSELPENGENRLFIHGEGNEFIERFQREHLLKDFKKGRRWSSRLHRWIDAGGNIRWMRDTVNLQRRPDTGNVYMFAYFVDDTQRHQWESLLNETVEYDKSGGLYSRQTGRTLMKKLLKEKKGIQCTMAVITLVGEMEEEGMKAAEKRGFIGTALTMAMGTDCILSIYKRCRILALFPETGSKFDVKRRIEDAFTYIRAAMTDIPGIERLRFIAGVITTTGEEDDFDAMVEKGIRLCNLWRNAAVDMVVFPEDKEGGEKGELVESVREIEKMDKSSEKLSEEGQETAFNCMTALLTADSVGEAVQDVLKEIGKYYQADRIYILLLSENKEDLMMPYEWMKEGKESIQNIVQGSKVNEIPALKQCMEKKMALFLERDTDVLKGEKKHWGYIAYPLQSKKRFFGFVGVENPGKNIRNDAILKRVIPYVLKEYGRFQDRFDIGEYAKLEMLSSLPNLRDYENRISSLNSDNYSSMGALAVDVPNYSLINSSSGFSYGQDILTCITEALDDIFGKTLLYRIWDAEFAVLLPDTIQDVFVTRCQRLRLRIQKRYPGLIRIGYTWADGVFDAKQLVQEARNIMKCEEVTGISSNGSLFPGKRKFSEEEAVPIKKYVPYFQPKIDLRDGSVIGAEALVRGIDENGGLVMPNRFIETLENSGEIRNLDFFMLENVLKQLEQWEEKGYPPVNVSVNISRKTLFNPTALASVLAIESRYPESLSKRIELEITETAGNVEKATLEKVVNQFRQFDIQFGLDDFGSRYANMSIFSTIKFRTIKLDRSLIDDLPGNDISKMMVANIASICKSFGMYCVAEGVETRQQVTELLKAGCIYGQGFYYSRPIPSWKFEEKYLNEGQRVN